MNEWAPDDQRTSIDGIRYSSIPLARKSVTGAYALR